MARSRKEQCAEEKEVMLLEGSMHWGHSKEREGVQIQVGRDPVCPTKEWLLYALVFGVPSKVYKDGDDVSCLVSQSFLCIQVKEHRTKIL